MKRYISPLLTFLIMFSLNPIFATSAKILPLQANGTIEIVGEANDCWYVSAMDYPKRIVDFQVNVYPQNGGSVKHFKLETSWGEYFSFVKSLILNDKFSIIYAVYDKRPTLSNFYGGSKEGNEAAVTKVMRQDYDLVTLKPVGSPQVMVDAGKDGFGMSGFDVANSEDKSKTALIFKSTLLLKKYKLMVYDRKSGLLYSKIYNQPEGEKEYHFPQFKVSNDGAVLLVAEGLSGGFRFTAGPVKYYFTAINPQGTAIKPVKVASPVGEKYLTDPVAQWVNGQIVTGWGFYKSKSSSDVVAIEVRQYDANMTLLSKKEIPADAKLMEQANKIEKGKDGFFSLRMNEIVPLSGGNFALVTECHHTRTESGDHFTHTITTQNYGIVYRFDDKLNVDAATFLPKKQEGAEFRSFMFGIKAFHIGDDIYLVYADDYKEREVQDMQLFTMHIPAGSGTGESQKLIKTSVGFLPSVEGIYTGSNGKLLTTAIKFKKGFYTGSLDGINLIQIDGASVKEH